ncbi:protein phosphatase 2C domain-containing protein [Nocardiopsis sp. EMB25]|uniref:PP2C family protein-serine/threonine phosphatase n=1 Tax=Nocardiopsis sp. EMB25 TaxID=2835867 RepID=UPI002283D4A6|nr:protein phosphatase 2C domain-containing protein [Nocardiopsis sp. EMB25]MCY9783443.1 protein phosphatase 2C domain-containing protein [Nocardiopsis sp. EMB25]
MAPDGRCWDCGAAQPSFRSRLETTAAGGAAGVSDRGLRRGANADAMGVVAAGGWTVGVVCDGVSMSPRSDRAALVAAQVGASVAAARLREGRLPEIALDDAVGRAGRAVAALAASADAAPACTYVAAAVGAGGVWVSWVGDSRAYWLPDEGPGFALTEDDTGAHDALSAWLGADAGDLEGRARSYRPSGPGRLLLCTDGLWRYLSSAEELRAAVPRRRPGSAADGPLRADGGLLADARGLVRHALDAGGHDNVTALLIPVDGCAGRGCAGADSG